MSNRPNKFIKPIKGYFCIQEPAPNHELTDDFFDTANTTQFERHLIGSIIFIVLIAIIVFIGFTAIGSMNFN